MSRPSPLKYKLSDYKIVDNLEFFPDTSDQHIANVLKARKIMEEFPQEGRQLLISSANEDCIEARYILYLFIVHRDDLKIFDSMRKSRHTFLHEACDSGYIPAIKLWYENNIDDSEDESIRERIRTIPRYRKYIKMYISILTDEMETKEFEPFREYSDCIKIIHRLYRLLDDKEMTEVYSKLVAENCNPETLWDLSQSYWQENRIIKTARKIEERKHAVLGTKFDQSEYIQKISESAKQARKYENLYLTKIGVAGLLNQYHNKLQNHWDDPVDTLHTKLYLGLMKFCLKTDQPTDV